MGGCGFILKDMKSATKELRIRSCSIYVIGRIGDGVVLLCYFSIFLKERGYLACSERAVMAN